MNLNLGMLHKMQDSKSMFDVHWSYDKPINFFVNKSIVVDEALLELMGTFSKLDRLVF